MAGFVDEFGLDGFDHVADLRGELWSVFGVSAQPSYVFIDDDGTMSRHIGGMETDDLATQLQVLVDS